METTFDFRGRTPKKMGLDWSDSGYLALSALNVKNGYIDKGADAHYGNQELYDKWMAGKELRKGQVLFTTEAPMGNVAQVPDNNGYILSQRTIAFKVVTSKVTDDFLAVVLRSSNTINELKAMASGGTAKGVSQKTLSELNVIVPVEIDEQTKIATFFQQLDHTITLHQRKVEQLKQLKKAYLEKIFSQQVRFSGFTENWEQRKFNELVFRLNKSTDSDRLPKVEFEDITAGEGRLNKDVSQKFDNRKGIEFLPNDILYGKLRPYLKNWLKASFHGVALGDFWVFRVNDNDSDFIYALIQADKYQRAANDTAGTKMPRSDWKKVSKTEFVVPRNIEEQQQIGTFFQQLDHFITLHQRKLDSLNKIKKFYLQNMFI
ncbi:restriction endonuclease subunit S [Enterococcus casseliflavus]|uniref:restriction endonuclease subunit S n=1 Tax=Enterococcus casseliflavus TaxID=37734 RepID=UPI003D0AD65B